MKLKPGLVIGWIATALIGALNIFAGAMKFMPVEAGSDQAKMMESMGMTPGIEHALGVLELTITVLFLIPRTATVGFVLMVGYLAGATATILTHNQDITFMVVIMAILTVSGYFRLPELSARLCKRPVTL
jgi:DoxX-like family